MIYDELFQEIESLKRKYIDIWEEVCNIESPTKYKEGVDAVGAYFLKMAKACGWKTEIFKQPKAGDVVCITMNPDSTERPITLSGHMDTVHPIGLFGMPPVTRDEQKIYGPGVTDCKGGIVAGFMAMDALEKIGFRDRPVQLLLQTDEEVGSTLSEKATIQYICEKAKDSVAFINLEGGTAGEACIMRKGIVTYKFSVIGKAAHSSVCSTEGASAIAEAAHKILELEKLKETDGLTCNCGLIQGGTTVNTVPERCEFFANFRWASYEDLNRTREIVHKVAETTVIEGCTCEINQVSYRTAMIYKQQNAELLERMNEVWKDSGMSPLKASKRTGGSDAADVTEYGIPCVDALGVEGGFIHSVKEFAWIESLKESAKRIAVVIVGLQKGDYNVLEYRR